jgi:hypothetical protein
MPLLRLSLAPGAGLNTASRTIFFLKTPHATDFGVKNGLEMLMCRFVHSAFSAVLALNSVRLTPFQSLLKSAG